MPFGRYSSDSTTILAHCRQIWPAGRNEAHFEVGWPRTSSQRRRAGIVELASQYARNARRKSAKKQNERSTARSGMHWGGKGQDKCHDTALSETVNATLPGGRFKPRATVPPFPVRSSSRLNSKCNCLSS